MSEKRKLQSSRKGKKAWRKNVDIADVEEGLEEKRDEERIVGKITEKDNSQLFMIDVAGDEKIKSKLAKEKPLRIDEILAQRSAVPAVTARVVPKQKKNKKKSASTEKKDAPAKSISNETNTTNAAQKNENEKRPRIYDIWGENGKDSNEDTLPVSKKQKVKAPATLVKMKNIAAEHIPAVRPALPGASYNPSMEDHQNLLLQAHEVEVKKHELKEKLEAKYGHLSNEVKSKGFDIQDMLDEEEEEEDDKEEVEEEGNGDEGSEQKKEAKRLTKKERNKQLRRAMQEKEEQKRQLDRRLKSELDQVQDISTKIEEEDKIRQQKLYERALKTEEKKKRGHKKLGKYKVQEAPIDVQLQEELSESLRGLKPEGNLFKERFLSLQERNLIEPRVPVKPRRKFKLKEYERHSYKDFK
ncbi:uncharacterized protein VTP21DRAFT_411 [Calcarisporiella thermophila]|uniref:uncharacterized protein n=1 Tax=Calcarisporiella thermophila TaxID=911321 RepID=UPI003742BB5D